MKKQSLLKGTMILGIATIFARFLGLFFRIPIQGLIGDQGMGYYQMSYPLYMTFVAIASGVPIAMSKLISEFNARNDTYAVRQVLKQTLRIMIPFGLVASFLMLYFGDNIITLLMWDEKSYESFIIISISPIFVCIMCTFKGYFQGLQNMNNTAIAQIIEQIGRVVFGVLGAYLLLPKGIEYAAAGAAFGTLAGGILGSIYLTMKYFFKKSKSNNIKVKRSNKMLSTLVQAALPISIGAAVGTIMSLIDSIIVPQRLLVAGYTIQESAVLYGQFTGKAMTLQNIPLALSIALSSTLVPIVSEVYSMHNQNELYRRVNMVFKLSFVIGIPSALGLFYLSKPIMGLVFMGDVAGHEILKLLSLSIPLIIITQTTTSLLQSCGRYMKPVYYLGIGCVFKVIITYILVSNSRFNIYGAIIGSIIGYAVTGILNLIEVKKLLKVKINVYEVFIKPVFVSLIMIISVVFIYNNVYNYTQSNGVSCLISIFLGIIVFGLLSIIFRIFTIEDVKEKLIKN
ncbi:polysaccharide biosynthesis protein [Clostridium sp. UBA1056]|uniref:putative polysaccharide biosynthesis protein n=1 Tax=unclassified Clostridium TaxID=2614128 RepID=UPI003216CCA1